MARQALMRRLLSREQPLDAVAPGCGGARRLAEQGGVSVNGLRAAAGDVVGADRLLHGRFLLLRRGPRRGA